MLWPGTVGGKHEPRQRRFALGGRLQEAAGGRSTVALPIRRVGGRALHNQFAVPGETGEPCLCGDRARAAITAAVSGPEPRTSTSRPASVAVTCDVERLCAPDSSASASAHAALSAPSRLWRQDRAAVDRHDLMGARGGKADFQHALGVPRAA